MKKNGPKDICYAALYDAKDADYISKLKPDYLTQKFEQKWNDHKSLPQLIQVSKSDDIVTFPGLSYCMQLILGLQTTRFLFFGAGSASNIADPFRQTLVTEASSRMNMSIPAQGSIVANVGGTNKITATGIFPSSFQTITVSESGIFTTSPPNTGIMLNRNVFSSVPITHVSGGTAFTLQSVITFSAVTAYG